MANSKISALATASTVAGTEVLPIVQSSATVKVAIQDLNPGLSTILSTKGGTGQTSYAVGDLLYANTTTTLAKLPDVATGNALISGGVSTAPSWGKIGLTTHVSGTLPVGNGGTGITTTPTNGQIPIGNGTNYTAATLTAGSGITVTNAAGAITVANIQNQGPTFLAYGTSGAFQTIPASTATKIAYSLELYDTNSNYDVANYRFLPTVAGYYLVVASVAWYPSGSLNNLNIYVNGSLYIGGSSWIQNTYNGIQQLTSGIIPMNGSTDYVEIYGYQNGAVGLNVYANGTTGSIFQAVLLRTL